MEKSTPSYVLAEKPYDFLKFFAQIVLPALGTLYFALSQIWGLPAGEQVVGTIVALDAFLGAILGISSKGYYGSDAPYDGTIEVEKDDADTKLFSLNLNSDPEELEGKKQVVFKVSSH